MKFIYQFDCGVMLGPARRDLTERSVSTSFFSFFPSAGQITPNHSNYAKLIVYKSLSINSVTLTARSHTLSKQVKQQQIAASKKKLQEITKQGP